MSSFVERGAVRSRTRLYRAHNCLCTLPINKPYPTRSPAGHTWTDGHTLLHRSWDNQVLVSSTQRRGVYRLLLTGVYPRLPTIDEPGRQLGRRNE